MKRRAHGARTRLVVTERKTGHVRVSRTVRYSYRSKRFSVPSIALAIGWCGETQATTTLSPGNARALIRGLEDMLAAIHLNRKRR